MDVAEFLSRTSDTLLGVTVENYRDLGDGTYIMVKPLMFHWTMIRGVVGDTTGYFDRWCYATKELAMYALSAFPSNPPSGYEPAGWHRHPMSGRRRPNGDPSLEHRDW